MMTKVYYILISVGLMLIQACSPNILLSDKSQSTFTKIETQCERFYSILGIRIYDIDIIASRFRDDIQKKSGLKIWMYNKEFESLSYEEKLQYEQYYQEVKDLYRSRPEFIDEFYNHFITAQRATDLYLFGYENPRNLSPSPIIHQMSIKMLEKQFSRKVNIDRLSKVSMRLLIYWQDPNRGNIVERTEKRRQFQDIIKAIDYCKTHSDNEIVVPLIANTFTLNKR